MHDLKFNFFLASHWHWAHRVPGPGLLPLLGQFLRRPALHLALPSLRLLFRADDDPDVGHDVHASASPTVPAPRSPSLRAVHGGPLLRYLCFLGPGRLKASPAGGRRRAEDCLILRCQVDGGGDHGRSGHLFWNAATAARNDKWRESAAAKRSPYPNHRRIHPTRNDGQSIRDRTNQCSRGCSQVRADKQRYYELETWKLNPFPSFQEHVCLDVDSPVRVRPRSLLLDVHTLGGLSGEVVREPLRIRFYLTGLHHGENAPTICLVSWHTVGRV